VAPPTLEVRRTIRAPRQRVFDAWTKAEELKAWHAPGPLTVSLAEIDLRVGGKYRIHMVEPDGKEHRVSGVYREIDPPRKVVYSWGWDGDHPVKDSTVTLEFFERGDATEVVLTHEGITHDEEREKHTHGWTSIMDKLESRFGAIRAG
ncbi:MAG TPA: SRPBCC domain-containing protein, partial [Gemmatimonadaceae bacterium]|nr:SRPBCC domain-containing protein [Gemmatimonadaceae bacterium]